MNTNRKVYLGLGLLCAIWAVGMMILVVNIEEPLPYPESEYYPYPDSTGYIAGAMSWIETANYNGPRTAGYLWFLALVYFLFGEYQASVQTIQILIGAATIFLVGSLTFRIAGIKAAWVTMFFFLLNPGYNAFITLHMTGALATSAFALFFLCAIQVIYNPISSNRNLLWCGFFLGVATFIRPIFYYLFFPVLPALVILLWWHHVSWGRIARKLACFALPWLVIIGSVHIRNVIVDKTLDYNPLGSYVYIQFVQPIFAGYPKTGYTKEQNDIYYALDYNPCVFLKNPTRCLELGNQRSNWFTHGGAIGRMYILENPFRTLEIVYANKLALFRGYSFYNFASALYLDYPQPHSKYHALIQFLQGKEMAWFPLAGIIYKWLLVFCSLAGIMFWTFSERKHQFTSALIWFIFIYFNLVSIFQLGTGYVRYRLPIVTIQSMFAGVGVASAFLWSCKGWVFLRERFGKNASAGA